MHKLLVLYNEPKDPAHFRKYYVETHVPLADKLPGLKASRYSFDAKPLGPERRLLHFRSRVRKRSRAHGRAAIERGQGGRRRCAELRDGRRDDGAFRDTLRQLARRITTPLKTKDEDSRDGSSEEIRGRSSGVGWAPTCQDQARIFLVGNI